MPLQRKMFQIELDFVSNCWIFLQKLLDCTSARMHFELVDATHVTIIYEDLSIGKLVTWDAELEV